MKGLKYSREWCLKDRISIRECVALRTYFLFFLKKIYFFCNENIPLISLEPYAFIFFVFFRMRSNVCIDGVWRGFDLLSHSMVIFVTSEPFNMISLIALCSKFFRQHILLLYNTSVVTACLEFTGIELLHFLHSSGRSHAKKIIIFHSAKVVNFMHAWVHKFKLLLINMKIVLQFLEPIRGISHCYNLIAPQKTLSPPRKSIVRRENLSHFTWLSHQSSSTNWLKHFVAVEQEVICRQSAASYSYDLPLSHTGLFDTVSVL